MLSPEIIALLIGGATLLFGAERLPKLARSAAQARKEFLVGQAEAEELAGAMKPAARK
jgi:Sec-independent protein translocase protein TatA